MSCVASSRTQVNHKSIHIKSTISIKCCINSSDICRIIIASRIRLRNIWHLIAKSRNKIWSDFTKSKQIFCKIGRNNTRMRRKRRKCSLWCYNSFCTKLVYIGFSTRIIIRTCCMRFKTTNTTSNIISTSCIFFIRIPVFIIRPFKFIFENITYIFNSI